MDANDARRLLESHGDDDFPVGLPPSVLRKLTTDDLPEGLRVEVGTMKDGIRHLDWSGVLFREGNAIHGEADHTWTRKYWYSPLGLEQYLDLVRRAVETRQRIHGDVELTAHEDDGAYVVLHYRIETSEENLGRAYNVVRRIATEVEAAAHEATDEVGKHIARVAERLSGWGSESLDSLIDAVETAANRDDKGRTLEELCCCLFESVAGFTVTGRIRTETEEIDIPVLNDSADPRLRREGAIILAECKNWTSKCGKDEFVLFRQKLENRSRRSTLGFLISWNGFAGTVTKEMLRGSREETLIVPMTGEEIRSAVRSGDCQTTLLTCWDNAVNT